MRLNELLKTGEVEEAEGNTDRPVTGLSYDSRAVKKGDLFFAVPGTHVDGHEFALQAVERGAAAVVLERRTKLPQDATWVRVRHVRRTMGIWADLFFSHPSRRMVLVGVTGTNGKTTVTYLVESIFSAAGMVSGVIGTINYRYRDRIFPAPHTTPESIDLHALLAEMAAAGVQSVAMEVSSHALAMERVRGIELDVGLFTNLSRDHLDFHGDMEDYFSTKRRLFTDHLRASSKRKRFAVIHGGDPRGAELLEAVREIGLGCVSYGMGHEWDIHPLEFEGHLGGLRGKIRMKDQELDFSSRLIGSANMENILGSVGVAFALGLPPHAIAEGIARLESVPGRLEKIQNGLGITVLVDYAHTPDALERALLALRGLVAGSKGAKGVGSLGVRTPDPFLLPKLVCVFGCGGDRDRGKRPLMGEVAARLGDIVVLTSDNPRSEEPLRILEEIEEGVKKTGMKKFRNSNFEIRNGEKGYFIEPDRRAAIRLALRLTCAGDLVLIAGKGHEDYQILGSKRVHFDDREIAREELDSIQNAK